MRFDALVTHVFLTFRLRVVQRYILTGVRPSLPALQAVLVAETQKYLWSENLDLSADDQV